MTFLVLSSIFTKFLSFIFLSFQLCISNNSGAIHNGLGLSRDHSVDTSSIKPMPIHVTFIPNGYRKILAAMAYITPSLDASSNPVDAAKIRKPLWHTKKINDNVQICSKVAKDVALP